MKTTALPVMAICTLLFISGNVLASVHATYCNGCNSVETSTAATNVANVGTDIIYVFNKAAKSVSKFQVNTYREDSRPFSILKEAYELNVEQDVKDAWSSYIQGVNAAAGKHLVLPPDFPQRSSAGALMWPGAANQHILDYMLDLPFWQDLNMKANTYVSAAVAKSIPVIDLKFDAYYIVVQFPDGSTQQYKITHMINIVDGYPYTHVSPIDNTATDQNGNSIPIHAGQLAGERFDNLAGSISEWIEYIRFLNVTINGETSPPPAHVTCSYDDTGGVLCVAQP